LPVEKKATAISKGGKMLKASPIYQLFLVLIVCMFVGTSVQTQEHTDERQNRIRDIEQQILNNNQQQHEIERQLRKTPGGEHRHGLERRLGELRNEQADLHRRLNELRTNGQEPPFIETIVNALKSPAVWAAIIGAIGAIIAALIRIKKRK
jgi:septal ring factor EnvC (AmiA/AmiB activator)